MPLFSHTCGALFLFDRKKKLLYQLEILNQRSCSTVVKDRTDLSRFTQRLSFKIHIVEPLIFSGCFSTCLSATDTHIHDPLPASKSPPRQAIPAEGSVLQPVQPRAPSSSSPWIPLEPPLERLLVSVPMPYASPSRKSSPSIGQRRPWRPPTRLHRTAAAAAKT